MLTFVICALILVVLYSIHHIIQLKKDIVPLSNLSNVLANPKYRGTLGEKIAEDIFKHLGMVEGINYLKQSKQENGKIPDYTILLPNNLKCHIDSKFPLTNYLKYTETNDKEYITKFIQDAKKLIKEVVEREYISPNDGTTNFAIVFLPNEQILYFLTEKDTNFIDFCLEKKVIIASPWTLYLIVAILKNTSDLYLLSSTQLDNIAKINNFNKEWTKYQEVAEKMEDGLENITKLANELNGVRSRKLEKAMKGI